MIELSIAEDYTDTPGLRFRKEGPYSGEAFREDLLEKKFKEALENNKKLEVNLDGTFGYATSFLEEAFGGLARSYGKDTVKNNIIFISEEDKGLYGKIDEYINNSQFWKETN